MDLEKDAALDEIYAMTLPFSRDEAPCECTSDTRWEEPFGCKDCAPGNAFSNFRSEAIKQTKKRWAWFSEARKLDNKLTTRLGTLGYLHWEIRVKIFRYVLDEYIDEALTYQTYESGFGYKDFSPSPLEWRGMKDRFKERFQIETRVEETELYKIFSLHSHKADHVEPDFLMPLRLATIDTKFEFDYVFLSTMTFRFSCQKALGLFLKELSATQLSQVRSITIEIFACNHYNCEGTRWNFKIWRSVCGQLPSTLDSINFELGCKGIGWKWFDGDPAPPGMAGDIEHLKRLKCAKELMEVLSCQVRQIALEAKVTMTGRSDDYNARNWDALDAVVRETDAWSKEYVQWKKGLSSAE